MQRQIKQIKGKKYIARLCRLALFVEILTHNNPLLLLQKPLAVGAAPAAAPTLAQAP